MKKYKKESNLMTMQIRLTREQLVILDMIIDTGKYSNRNEAIRDAVRQMLEKYDSYGNLIFKNQEEKLG